MIIYDRNAYPDHPKYWMEWPKFARIAQVKTEDSEFIPYIL